MRKSFFENLGALQTKFDEADKIWREKVDKLLDHLKAQQRGMTYMVIQKLFLFATFWEFINKCSATMVDAVITEALEKVKSDCQDVNVAQREVQLLVGVPWTSW